MTFEEATEVVRVFEAAYATAFNRRDAHALAALLLDDATLMTEWGDVVRGREPFERVLARAFAVRAGSVRLENRTAHVGVLTDDVLVTHGTSARMTEPGAAEEILVYTRVLVRRGDQWWLAANHVAEPSTRPDPRTTTPRTT